MPCGDSTNNSTSRRPISTRRRRWSRRVRSPATTNSPPRSSSRGVALWRKRRDRHLAELRERVRARQESAGDVAYRLEPDLKDGHGGLRDVQSLWWAEEADSDLIAEDLIDLDRCYDVLLRARVALHLATGRAGDVLRLEDQDAAAAAGGWQRRRRADGRRRRGRPDHRLALRRELGPRRSRRSGSEPERAVAPGVVLRRRRDRAGRRRRPRRSTRTLVLQTAVAAARHQCRIGRATLDRLHDDVAGGPARGRSARPTNWSRCCSRGIARFRCSSRSTSAT